MYIPTRVHIYIYTQDSEGRAHSVQHGAAGDAARELDVDSGLDVSIVHYI